MKYVEIAYMGRMEPIGEDLSTGFDMKSRTLTLKHKNIINMILDEIIQYETVFAKTPKMIMLSTSAYESLFVWSRKENNSPPPVKLYGVDVIYNMHQNRTVVALGEPEDELIYGGLYSNEQ